MAERRLSPKRFGSSPPSPVLDRPPIWFMAMASVSWLSCEMDPNDMAPVANRFTISDTGSTSSRGTAVLGSRSNLSRPRSCVLRTCSSVKARYRSYSSRLFVRTAACNAAMLSAVLRCASPPSCSSRRWYCPVFGMSDRAPCACGPVWWYATACRRTTSSCSVAKVAPWMRLVVPVKHTSITSSASPTASKICAPL